MKKIATILGVLLILWTAINIITNLYFFFMFDEYTLGVMVGHITGWILLLWGQGKFKLED